jgi:ATP-dependent Zn protease
MGGKAAEELVFGHDKVTSGISAVSVPLALS